MRRRYVLFGLLALTLLMGVWGFNQYTLRQNLEVQAENQYARAFQELGYYVDSIETVSAKALVSASRMQRMKDFSDIWRNAYAAQAQLGQLPLTNVPLERTEDFLANIGAFTYDLGMRNLDSKNHISEKEWQTMKRLHDQAQYISRSLDKMASSVNPGSFKWTNVGREVIATAVGGPGGPSVDTKSISNPVVKSFVMMENGLSRFPNAEYKGNPINYQAKPKFITGSTISRNEARKMAADFIGSKMMKGRRMVFAGRTSGQIPTYSFQARSRTSGVNDAIWVDITQKGGHVMWMLNQRQVASSKLSLKETSKRGLAFLEERGFKLFPIADETFQNVAVHSYAYSNGEYIIYPELVKVQVARDNGEILGVDATNYLTFHEPDREIVPPVLSQGEAQRRVDKHLKLDHVRKVVIMNDQYEQVACYEFEGTVADERFRVYINTATGDEEKITRDVGEGVNFRDL